MAVVGEVHPDKMLTNAGLRPGQTLVLTKPLGIGVITTAIKGGVADEAVVAAAVASMTRTNAEAARVAVAAGATGATDVTGFGLLGHGGRMAEESAVDLDLRVDRIPVIDGARDLAADGVVPGGTGRNLDWVSDRLDPAADVSELDITILADAQTSGGLLFGVDPTAVADVLASLRDTGHTAAAIGAVTAGDGTIRIHRT